jgi:hypothetical protein
MKKIFLAFIVLFIYSAGSAQFYKSVLPSPDFTSALEKIVLAYRLDYKTIQVDSVFSPGDGYESYGSSVKLPGSTLCEILRFHSADDTTSAFHASFYQGEDFDAASKAYQNCITLIKKSKMRWVDRRTFTFDGETEKADPNKGFTVSILRLNTDQLDDERYKGFCAEVEIRGNVTGWEVNASFHLKRSDTEGPSDGK